MSDRGDDGTQLRRHTYRSEAKVQVDLVRFWSAMAVIAAIAAFAGVAVIRMAGDVFDVALLIPDRAGADELVPLSDGRVIWSAVIVTAAAGSTLNLMLYLAPRPEWFYSILSVVVLAVSLVWPFSLDVDGDVQAWLVILNVTVGLIILVLSLAMVPSVTRVARRD